eukprot:tig00021254_g19717.t2
MAPAAPAEEEEAPIVMLMLADELLMKILRTVASELPPCYDGRRWLAALREAHALRAVCKRFKEAIDAAGGALALFENVCWDVFVARWLAGRRGGVDAFLAERAPLLTGLREVTFLGGLWAQHGARFLAALPCWPSLLSLRLLYLPTTATGELRACLDALAAVPAGKLSLRSLEVSIKVDEYSEDVSALVGAIVRRCAPSLRALTLRGIAVEGGWEDLLPAPGLRELCLEKPPRPVALGGLERSGAAATLETLEVAISIGSGDPFEGPEGRDSARALAALPALSRLTIDTSLAGPGLGPAPPAPPAGSFPALRHLTLRGPATPCGWWAAALTSPAGARLERLSLRGLADSGRVLGALQASGPPLALRSLFLRQCRSFGGGDALRLEGLLAACPALRELNISDCSQLFKRKETASLVILLAGLPALEKLVICDCVDREDADDATELPLPPEGSFPSLRVLKLEGRSTVRVDWWAAALASPAGARLESLILDGVAEAWRVLAALGASGPPPALRSLSFARCPFGAGEAPRLAGLLAACPALTFFGPLMCPGVQPLPAPSSRGRHSLRDAARCPRDDDHNQIPEFLAGRGNAEAAGPRLLRELKARGVRVVWSRLPPPSSKRLG